MEQGTVKWFDASRGYGRIRTKLDGEDSIFVHFSKIQMEGYKSLVQNEEVFFEIVSKDHTQYAGAADLRGLVTNQGVK